MKRGKFGHREFRVNGTAMVMGTIAMMGCLLTLSACGGPPRESPPPPPASAVPTYWPLPGTYSPTQVELFDSTANSVIYYTTDGSTPTASSSKYTAPIALTSSATIKAIATAPDLSPSAVASGVYTVPAQNGAGPAVSVAVTTHDRLHKMESQGAISFTTSKASGRVIYVDETQKYQVVEGFGAAFTESAAYLLNEVGAPKSAVTMAMNDLFTRNGHGIGLSFMRTPMGASDLALSQYSYDDNKGNADPTLANFSIAHDDVDVIPIIQQARALNPKMKLLANPWSPPGWMKTNNSMVDGGLQPNMYEAWAHYFVKYLQAYAAAGINVDYLSVQNEPLIETSDYPGMCIPAMPGETACKQTWMADETTAIRDHLLPALAGASLNTKVLVVDDSWGGPEYLLSLMADPTLLASPQIAGTAWHGYSGTPGVMTVASNMFPAKGNYETEHSGFVSNADQVKLDFEEIIHVMRSWGRSYVKWSLALDQNSGPHSGGCTNCTPIVTVNSTTGAISYGIEYYTLGHFSKFVLPGASRIYSSNADGLISAAFLNTDGSKALVVFNDSNSTQSFQVQWGDQSFAYALPSFAGATFSWTGAQTGSYAMDAKSQIQASSFNYVNGNELAGDLTTFGPQTELTSDGNGGYDLGSSSGGDFMIFKNVDFGTGVSQVNVRMACNSGNQNCGGGLIFRVNAILGILRGPFAGVEIPSTASRQTFTTVTAPINYPITGVVDIRVEFVAPPGGTSNLGNLNWFQFQ